MINILGNQNSVLNEFVAEIRDAEIQKDPMRFRKNMERIGEIFAYEVSKHLEYIRREVITLLGVTEISVL